MRGRGRGQWLARLTLRGFGPEEVEEILRDLRELAADRGPIRAQAYFWTELLKYPLRRAIDGLRHGTGDIGHTGEASGMDGVWKDTRYAVRSLVRNPGFTTMAVAIITLGMGAATAISSVVDGVLLDPLPVDEPDRLVSIWLAPVAGDGRSRMTPGNFVDIAGLEGVFSHVAAFQEQTTSMSLGGEPVFLRGGSVTYAYFEALGVRPVVGRSFRADEGESGGPPVVILSHHLWEQAFGADPSIVGRAVNLDGFDFEVVGVAPPGVYPTQATVSAELPFTTANQDFFVPLRYGEAGWANRRSHLLGMIARLSPTTTPEEADAALGTLARLRAEEPLNQNERFLMTSFSEEVVGDVRVALLTLLGMVALVLLIAITNVGALFVLRADDRSPEMAIRVALGAPRSRLIRQLVIESALVVGVSSVGSVLIAGWGLDLMRALVPYQIPRLADVGIGFVSLAVAGTLGLVIALVFGLAPALRLGRDRGAGQAVRQARTGGQRQRRLQATVVAIQAGLGVVVLVGATLLTRSYIALRAVDTGFSAHETWTMTVPAPRATLEDIVRGVRELPGVATAAIAYDHPLERNWGDGFRVEGVELSESDAPPSGSLRPFGEGYFGAVGIDVVAGRVPDGIDMAGSVAYAVINETLRDTYLPGIDPIGARIILPTAQRMLGTDGIFEVLGVVRDVRFLGPDQPVSPALYVPLSHFPVNATTLLVRPGRADIEVLARVRQVVRAADAGLAVQNPQRLEDILNGLLARPRFNMMLLLSFAAMGLTLCGLGAYGLVGRVVVMRSREIGIQMALGADRARLARSVMASALRPMVLGGLLGLVASVGLARVIGSLLFAVSPTDPVSLSMSPTFVILMGAAAAVIPTLRAVSIDPATTLRGE